MTAKIIPGRFRAEYDHELSRLFNIRVNLFCYIAIIAFSIEVVLGLTVFRHLLTKKDMPGIIGGTLFSLALLATAKFARSLKAQKARAFFLSFLLILISILAATAHPEIITYLGITLVLLALFSSSLLLPWNWLEAAVVGVFTLVNFTWIYLLEGTFVNNEIFAINLILLAIAAFVCVAVERSEEVLRMKSFASRKETEEKSAIMAKELDLANVIHKSLIPHSMKHELADIAVTYKPMLYMGGDYAKFHFIDKEKLFFILADITGHGVSSALLVNRLHSEIERLIREKLQPGELLKKLDDFINRDFGKMGYFLSAFGGLLDFSRGKLIYSNYGHPPQMLLQSSRKNVILMKSQTFLMGIGMDTADVFSAEINFQKGDRLILFTDGIIEAQSPEGELFENHRLEKFAKENANLDVTEFNKKLVERVESFQAGEQQDDIFLLTVQTKKRGI